MMRYSVNIGFIFADMPIRERIAAVRGAGFDAIESFWPGSDNVKEFIDAVDEFDMQVALINVDEGDYVAGDRGFAADRDRQGWWRTALEEAIALAERVGCPNLNVLTGYLEPASTKDAQRACLVENLRWAAPKARDHGVDLLLEPLNATTHHDYICTTVDDAIAIIEEVDRVGLGVQFDCYQVGRGQGENVVAAALAESMDYVRHIQLADTPQRGAPGTGNLDFRGIFEVIASSGYTGYVGLEYIPDPKDPFGWIAAHG